MLAFVFGHEIDVLQRGGESSGTGTACLLDEQDGVPEVVHLYPLKPIDQALPHHTVALEWHLNQSAGHAGGVADDASPATVWIDTRSAPAAARCQLRLPGQPAVDCPAEIVESGSRAFTRNTPILETDALSRATVLCVGLGSGGSVVVDQLARSGVGRFLLWDMDRLESHNVGRHLCTLRDLGRKKVFAVRDHLRSVNPAASVKCFHQDVLKAAKPGGDLEQAVAEADCIIVGTDNNASRFAINDVAWRLGKPAIYGRAFTRAAGGDVIQVIPGEPPCYACQLAGHVVDEEISSPRDANRVAYAPGQVPVQPGLAIDIYPVANMIARLCLLRLCEKTDSPLKDFAAEMTAPLYLWANRREYQFAGWRPMERSYDRLAVLRWYGVTVLRDPECATCGSISTPS